jgi:predicted transposase YbfD/YdcC
MAAATRRLEKTDTREFIDGRQAESATRLYITSRNNKASKFMTWVRQHWGIENQCHWITNDVIKKFNGNC